MDLAWPASLDRPPRVLHTAITRHGSQNEETWADQGFWSLHVYRYHAKLEIDGQWYRITPGTVSVFRPRARLRYQFNGISEHVYAHFEWPTASEARWAVPAVTHPRAQISKRLDEAMREAAGWFVTEPVRSSTRLWDVLWQLARPVDVPDRPAQHPLVTRAMELIELRLEHTIYVQELAEELRVSHNHLVRLFRSRTGRSVIGYIRHRRAARAEHLITRTDLPLKAIAIQVGLGDLQLFNKTIRRELGHAPSALRTLST